MYVIYLRFILCKPVLSNCIEYPQIDKYAAKCEIYEYNNMAACVFERKKLVLYSTKTLNILFKNFIKCTHIVDVDSMELHAGRESDNVLYRISS